MSVVQRQVRGEAVEARGTVVVLLGLHIAAALNRLLHQLLEVKPFHTGVFQIKMRLPLPLAAESIGINFRAGEVPRQRQLPRQRDRVVKRGQDGAYLNVIETRLEFGAGNVFTDIQRAGQ